MFGGRGRGLGMPAKERLSGVKPAESAITVGLVVGVAVFGLTLAMYKPPQETVPLLGAGRSGRAVFGGPAHSMRGTGDPAIDIPVQLEYTRDNPGDARGWYFLGRSRLANGEAEAARECWRTAAAVLERTPEPERDAVHNFRLTRYLALCGERERAIKAWIAAVDGGFGDRERAANDPDLESIRSDEAFVEALNRIKPAPPRILDAR